jgi:hypothetical protein
MTLPLLCFVSALGLTSLSLSNHSEGDTSHRQQQQRQRQRQQQEQAAAVSCATLPDELHVPLAVTAKATTTFGFKQRLGRGRAANLERRASAAVIREAYNEVVRSHRRGSSGGGSSGSSGSGNGDSEHVWLSGCAATAALYSPGHRPQGKSKRTPVVAAPAWVSTARRASAPVG